MSRSKEAEEGKEWRRFVRNLEKADAVADAEAQIFSTTNCISENASL